MNWCDIINNGSDSMTFYELLEMLLSDDVYNKLKQNEQKLFELIPELKTCKGFNQNNKWHIYDVYEHILHVIDNTKPNIYLRLCALFHDIGKPLVYIEDENGIGHFYNHWNKSIEIFKKYQECFELSAKEIALINALIFYHDIKVNKLNVKELKDMIDEIGETNVKLLSDFKRADLLAQSPEFHNQLLDINNQEEKVKIYK